jgi:4-carboxymuconolactone decarboxylase
MANPSSSKGKIKPVVPKLFDIIETTIYGDIWERPELSKRDRSMITVSTLIGMRQWDQLRSHMEKALDNGMTATELSEMLTQIAFYAGFPAVLSAALIAKPLLIERGLLEPEGAE